MDKIKAYIKRNPDGSVEFEFDKEGFNSEDAKSAIETYLNNAKEVELARINKAKELENERIRIESEWESERLKIESENTRKFYENLCNNSFFMH